MATGLVDQLAAAETGSVRAARATIGSAWLTLGGSPADDDFLAWPPDVFAFTDVILGRAQAYRFAVSPPVGEEWPPTGARPWRDEVTEAARRWARSVDAGLDDPPPLVVREWQVVRDALATPLGVIASGRAWRICQALLTLHAVADEACAGAAAGTPAPDHGVALRTRMSELLAGSGSLARIDPEVVRVLPKYRTAPGGISSRSISRYLSVVTSSVGYGLHRVRTPRRDSAQDRLNVLLLPWPLRVSAEDFRPLSGSTHERDIEPYGFFEFQPAEPFAVSLVERLLTSASEYVDEVDVVVLPESSVPRDRVADLETLLARKGVSTLIAGIRDEPSAANPLGSNWVHFGVAVDGEWSHYRQDKHHRWSLDRSQIQQYHLEDVLDPRVRWWEAIEINRRSVQMIERDDGQTIAALVCEDLAQMDEVTELLRAVGPTMIVGLLLDGPQLASRWTARYASVLADDPGSGVLTLTSYGMVANARQEGAPPSSVVALWKDTARGLHEIPLDAGAQGILLGLRRQSAIRRTADGRLPDHSATDLRIAEVTQLRSEPNVLSARG